MGGGGGRRMSTLNVNVQRRHSFPVFPVEIFTDMTPSVRLGRMCWTCGLRWRLALLISCLLGYFLLQTHFIFFLLPYPFRKENTTIWRLLISLRYKCRIQFDLIFHPLPCPACWQRISSRQPLPAALGKARLVRCWGSCQGCSPVVKVNGKKWYLDCWLHDLLPRWFAFKCWMPHRNAREEKGFSYGCSLSR